MAAEERRLPFPRVYYSCAGRISSFFLIFAGAKPEASKAAALGNVSWANAQVRLIWPCYVMAGCEDSHLFGACSHGRWLLASSLLSRR